MKKILTPAVRKWAYGVTAAALSLGVALGFIPVETHPAVLVLVMALFNVDSNGKATEEQ